MIRIALSVFLGGLLGVERGIKNKPAGLRTYMLVSLGSTIVMMTNQYIFQVFNSGDLVRLGAQVISGIGFLGAGTIIVTRKNQVQGLTTAASLWGAAANGLAIGIGAYEIALLCGIVLYLTVEFLHKFDYLIDQRKRAFDFFIGIDIDMKLADFLEEVSKRGIVTRNIEYSQDRMDFKDMLLLIISFENTSAHSYEELYQIVREIEGVRYVEKL